MRYLVIAISTLALAEATVADSTLYFDFDSWARAVRGDYATITFAEADERRLLDDQYADLGVLFPELDDRTSQQPGFQQDGWGAISFNLTITLDFGDEVHWIGVHFPGALNFRLYNDDVLVEEILLSFPPGYGFGGLVTTQPFDRAVLIGGDGVNAIDDLHIQVVPHPSVLAALLPIVLVRSRQRRAA